MKNVMKKGLSLVLVIIMILALSVPAFAATARNVKKYNKMLVMGDSIVCADELSTTRDFAPVVNSYSYDLAHELGLETYTSLAFRAASALDELYLLGVAPDDYMSSESHDHIVRILGQGFMDRITNVRNGNTELGNPRDRVAEADLIVIQVGNNDVSGRIQDLGINIEGLLTGDENIPKRLIEVTSALNRAIDQFKTYYPALIREVQKLSPNADIVLVGNYNPFAQISLLDGNKDIAIGNLLSTTTLQVNSLVKSFANKYDCFYVDTFALSEEFPAQSLISGLGTTPMHPTIAGHKWIASQILAVLPTAEKRISLPQKGSVRFAYSGDDAGVYTLSRNGLLWNIFDPSTGKYLSVGSEATLVSSASPAAWGYDGGFFRIDTVTAKSIFGFNYSKLVKVYLTDDGNGGITTTTSKSKVTMFAVG